MAAAALHAWARSAQFAVGGRLTRVATIHLTLAFLGAVEDEQVAILRDMNVAGKSCALPIEHAGYWAHNRIVWVGPSAIPPLLEDLVRALRGQLAAENFRTEQRPFAAHVSMIRRARAPAELPPLPVITWPVDEVALVRSCLSASGPDYEILKRYALS